MERGILIAIALFLWGQRLEVQSQEDDEALAASVEELRTALGEWEVVTEFLDQAGKVAGSAQGTYVFDWVVEDRVLSGRSEIPALGLASGILFYLREKEREIEMVSVGADGKLWIMTGPLGGDMRTSQEYRTAEGRAARLRFTRFAVTEDGFESRMESTDDGGATWLPGNHQVFRRRG